MIRVVFLGRITKESNATDSITSNQMKSPVTIYVVHHPKCKLAEQLASSLFDWFRLGYLGSDSNSVGVPVYFRRSLSEDENGISSISPSIDTKHSDLTVIIVLVDHEAVVDPKWRSAIVGLASNVDKGRSKSQKTGKTILLPVAIHESFYRTGILYKKFNPVRLLELNATEMERKLRRAATETIAREVRIKGNDRSPPPLKVFLSHAKRDGTKIAEAIRDGIRRFSQMEAWYDSNDLRYGDSWESPMTNAAQIDTAALIATVTDAYPTRPWCQRESRLARTPVLSAKNGRIWQVQPVVAVARPGTDWVRGVEMLTGVPRIGWQEESGSEQVARILDRLVLEVLLVNIHVGLAEKLVTQLQSKITKTEFNKMCFITWVPDVWTLAELRFRLNQQSPKSKTPKASSIRQIVYPGHGLTESEKRGLLPIVRTFHNDTELISFEEAWK